MDYKNIGDNLTVKEFNGIISLLRDNINFSEDITINTSSVTGQYGTYTFEFNEATILDDGILITNETLSTVGSVTLSNPIFPNSHYYLDLKVYSSSDIGVYGLDGDDVTVTELSIQLLDGISTSIPFETLDMNNIIGFDATVRIDHKDLVIRGEERINLSASASQLEWGGSLTLTARYLDNDNQPISNENITFYNGESYVGVATTNTNGYATLPLTLSTIGDYSFIATCGSISSSNVTVIVTTGTPIISLSANRTGTFVGDTVTVTGNISYNSTGLDSVSIELYDGSDLIDTLTTDSNGDFTSSVSVTAALSLIAIYDGNTLYEAVTSETIVIPILDPALTINITGSSFSTATLGTASFIHSGDVYIDYGDGTVEEYDDTVLSHSYSNSGNYTIIIYGNVTGLSDVCFQRQTGITSVTIGDTITSLGIECFDRCGGLTSLNIPSNISSIGDDCFRYCINLTDLYLNWEDASTIIAYDSTTWLNYSSITTFHVPSGTISEYVSMDYPESMLDDGETVSSVSLTSSSTVLSYVDGDTCTLTATALNDSSVAVEGATIEFFNNGTSIGTATTDSNGQATKTYTAANNGDIIFTAEETSSSSTGTCTVTDIYKYDDASSDKTSNYSTANLNSLTHATDHYVAVRTLGSDASTFYSPIYLNDFTLPTNYELSVDILSTDFGTQDMLNIVDSPVTTYSGATEFGILATGSRYGLFKRVSGSGTFYTTSGALTSNQWYNFKVTVEGTTVTGVITDSDDNIIHTATQTISEASSFHKFTVIAGGSAHTIHFKNIRVEEL